MALTDKLTAIANAIRSKTGGSDLLTLDEMPQEIQSIQTGGGGTSEELDTLIVIKGVDSSPSITKYETQSDGNIREYAFCYCYYLTQVDIPNISCVKDNAFYFCKGLEQIELPSVKLLGNNVFSYASSLNKIVVQGNTAQIGTKCFNQTSLTALVLNGSTAVPTLLSSSAFSNTPIASGTGYIYVPQALIEQYKVATNWATYANQFRAIEDYPEICGDAAANANGEVS